MKNSTVNEKGFTLIEVLVAVFLLAVGMLSAASMQTTAISGNKFSKDTSLAIELAEEMIDRIRVNGGNEPHKYDGIDTSQTCTGSNPVLGDCTQWQSRMMDDSLGLKNARGKVAVTPANPDATNGSPMPNTATVQVEIIWGSKWMGKTRSIIFTTIIETWVG